MTETHTKKKRNLTFSPPLPSTILLPPLLSCFGLLRGGLFCGETESRPAIELTDAKNGQKLSVTDSGGGEGDRLVKDWGEPARWLLLCVCMASVYLLLVSVNAVVSLTDRLGNDDGVIFCALLLLLILWPDSEFLYIGDERFL